MTLTEIVLALTTLLGGLAAAWQTWTKSRSDVKVTESREQTASAIAEREQLMKEYGLLLSGMREEIVALRANQSTMWNHWMNRANVEFQRLQHDEDCEMASGFKVGAGMLAKARQTLDPIKDSLRELYRQTSDLPLDERDDATTLAIARQHDKFIVNNICKPNGLSHSECLLIALSVAKNGVH